MHKSSNFEKNHLKYMFTITRIINFVRKPEQEWITINEENKPVWYVFLIYALPLIILEAVSNYIGTIFLWKGNINYAFTLSLLGIAIPVLLIVIGTIITTALAGVFKSEKNLKKTATIFIYSLLPFYISGMISNLHPSLGFVKIIGIYSIYLLYEGLSVSLDTPYKKITFFTGINVVALIFSWLLLIVAIATIINDIVIKT